jgi:hypothetical protein
MTAEAKSAVETYISDVMSRVGELQAKAVAAAAAVASIGATSGGSNAITAAANAISTSMSTGITSTVGLGRSLGGGRGGYADGGMSVPGGYALVGERGPELVQLPGGASVIPNSQSMRTLEGAVTTTGRSSSSWTGKPSHARRGDTSRS